MVVVFTNGANKSVKMLMGDEGGVESSQRLQDLW